MDKLTVLLENQNSFIKLLNYPSVIQSSSDKSGVSAVQSVLAYYGENLKEEQLNDKLVNSDIDIIEQSYVTSIENIIDFFMNKDYQIDSKNMNINDLINYIDRGIPVIMMIQAWGGKTDYSDEWNYNHYVVAIGYTKKDIIFEDPNSFNTCRLSHTRLIERWHGRNDLEKYTNFGIAIKGKKPEFDKNNWIEID
jgi:predicted double-glycine peptidase